MGKSVRGSGAEAYLNEKGLGVLAALDKISAKHNASPASVSLAWLLHQPHIGAPIVSATKPSQLEALLQAPTLPLDNEDLAILNEASK